MVTIIKEVQPINKAFHRMNGFYDWYHNRVKNVHPIDNNTYDRIIDKMVDCV